ncbi:uroporphyrinogen decarboxylase family protein [Paenibacillus wynnii]|uniref:uroporphyrinogen decarboxylase family protein n=1 Tax=Paenibacillus wynnii TaxID=268407 RepID=UPI00278F6B7D|nr:uroporphyrinogen decarboxylase family protein [Paenibacillus wynnii]MDQ0194939.1 uroporphyrinogen decarboxylase [Paenibacillus wynnii]
MSQRQLVLDALQNKPVERIPVGFWFHFVQHDESFKGLEDASIIQRNIDGHKQYFQEFRPDFVKLMSDGFFGYPSSILSHATSAAELRELRPVGAEHPWIVKQVELVKTLTSLIGADVLTFYNVFAPATYFKFAFGDDGNKVLADYIAEDKEAVKHALDVIAEDITTLAHRIVTEGKADGIYFSVQNVQDPRVTSEIYREVVAPGELRVLAQANEVSDNNILHICGYEGSRNDLSLYLHYESKAINWAVNNENISLVEGKELFGGRAVIGGFDNNRTGLLYSGSQKEIEDFTEQTIRLVGKTGIILGADCTLPSDIELERLNWVRNKAASL